MARPVLGLVEQVTLKGKRQKTVWARIDTGATKSSVDKALADQLDFGPTIREKLVKSASGNRLRPIVKGSIVISKKTLTDEFSVADRSHLSYPVLIGQNILKKGEFIIDPLKKVKK